MSATILRKRVRRDFVQTPNETVRDPELSFKAVGVLVHMLSLPDGATISAEKLAEGHSEGRAAVLSALKELRDGGYYRTVKQRGADGRMFTVCEVADTRGRLAEPECDNRTSVDPSPECENRTPVPEAGNRTPVEASPKCGYPTFGDRTSKEEDLLEIPTDTPCSPPATPSGTDVERTTRTPAEAGAVDPVTIVFEAWKQTTGHPRAVLDAKRRRTIERAMNPAPKGLGFSLDEILDAIRGWTHSSFHRGDNDRGTVYDDIGLILRDASKVEGFMRLQREPRIVPSSNRRARAERDAMAAFAVLDERPALPGQTMREVG